MKWYSQWFPIGLSIALFITVAAIAWFARQFFERKSEEVQVEPFMVEHGAQIIFAPGGDMSSPDCKLGFVWGKVHDDRVHCHFWEGDCDFDSNDLRLSTASCPVEVSTHDLFPENTVTKEVLAVVLRTLEIAEKIADDVEHYPPNMFEDSAFNFMGAHKGFWVGGGAEPEKNSS